MVNAKQEDNVSNGEDWSLEKQESSDAKERNAFVVHVSFLFIKFINILDILVKNRNFSTQIKFNST